MNKEELWAHLCKHNPGLLKPEPRFTRAGIRKFYDVVYDNAYRTARPNPGPVPDVIQELLGGFRR
jgi:hypothetical protein